MKFADDLSLSIPVTSGASNSNSATNEVQSIVEWTYVNRMQLNFKKTWEALPVALAFIERKLSLKLLGLTFQSNPCNWDLPLDNILLKASSRFVHWIIFIFFLLVLFYLYLHMLWKYGAARIIIST